MNERIDKLLVKAGAYFGGDGVVYDTFDPKKFAELIVRECMKVAVFKDSGTISTAEVAGWMAAGRSTAAKMIKEHFGVEE
jgi:uncharacterized membrane protein (DUF441 family)